MSFGLDGVAFEIDLNEEHAVDLRIGSTVCAGGPAGPGHRGVSAGSRRTDMNRDRNAAIRQWMLDAGVELPGRRRIARGVQAAYDAVDVPSLYAATELEME